MGTRLLPVSRADFVKRLRRLGYDGPYSGGKHEYMVRGARRMTLPNPHSGDIGPGFLKRLLEEAGVEREEWERTA